MKRTNPGSDFEAAILRSLPASVYHRKAPTPPRPAPVRALVEEVERLCHGHLVTAGRIAAAIKGYAVERENLLGAAEVSALLDEPAPAWLTELHGATKQAQDFAGVAEWVTLARKLAGSFTLSPGVDLTVTAPCMRPPLGSVTTACRPLIVFSLELKSEAGTSIAFDRLGEAQEKELVACAKGGHVAGVVIEWRKVGEVHFVPVLVWAAERDRADRKSLAMYRSREIGVRIELDPGRIRTLSYWKMGEFIRRYGGEV